MRYCMKTFPVLAFCMALTLVPAACGGGGGGTPETPRTWGTAVLIETSDYAATDPRVAVDAEGNAFAVWQQYDGTSAYDIYANIYNGTDWEGAEIIDAGNNSAVDPQVAVDSSGNAFAVWRQHDGTFTYDIYANRYDAGAGWTGAVEIDVGNDDAAAPQVAFDADGNAFAVWRQYNGVSADDIYANRYVAGTGWGTAKVIDVGNGDAAAPQLAVDPDGNAVAVWYQSDGTYDSIYANRYE